jgi:hypothetical protein
MLSKLLLAAALLSAPVLAPGVASSALIGARPGSTPPEASVQPPLHGASFRADVPSDERLTLSDPSAAEDAGPGSPGDLNAVALSVPVDAYPADLVLGD